ncbi:MAG TPA: ABC transporter permease subunit [Bacteroidota bacterium]|jgi:ABC-2 type transport system permease protein|nr:ABC transporter permease subunit [Bacteroidota bacterium]
MIRLIIEKELREIIGSTRFAITFAICSILILLSFYVGARNYQVSLARHEAAKRENIRRMEGLTDWFSVQEVRVFLPPQPLAALVTGVSNDIGRTTEVRGRGELSAEDSRFNDDPIFAVFRFLDLDFIFQIVLSLFAILFAYDTISGEKERGTLRLSFANAVPKDKYILGKLVGSFLALAVPLVLPMLIGCLLLPLLGVPMNSDEWLRLSLIIGCGLLYFGAFLSIAIFVSTRTQRTSSSFVMLLVVWIFAVLIIPRTSVLFAGRAVDVPSVDEIASQKNRLSAQLWEEDRKKMGTFKPAASNNQPEKIMQEFNSFMQSIADEREKKMEEFGGRLNEERANRQRVQERLAFGLARVSPSATFSLAATSLAGTSLSLKDHFREAANAYQKQYARFMKEKTGMVTGGRMMMFRNETDNGHKPKPIDPGEMPSFAYDPPSVGNVFGAALPDIGLLALFNIIFFIAAYVGFLRYDVR